MPLPTGKRLMRRRDPIRRLIAGETVSVGPCLLRATVTYRGHIGGLACIAQDGSRPASRDVTARSERALDGEGPCWGEREGGICGFLPCRRGRLARKLVRQLCDVLAEPDCPEQVRASAIAQLARSPEPAARTGLARDPSCPEEILDLLARDWWWEVRAGVASNLSVSPARSERLACDESSWVRRALAENPRLDRESLSILARDEDLGVRDAIAEHPDCPGEVMSLLSRDLRWEIRRSVAKRQDAPAAVLVELARDPEHWIRFFVACNPATPAEVRDALSCDPRPTVRGLARRPASRARATAIYLATDRRPRLGRDENSIAPEPSDSATSPQPIDPDPGGS